MSYSDRREEKKNLGLALDELGWTLHGWKEDRSDSMTDYYDPASWGGVAEKDGYVVGVDIYSASEGGDITKTTPVQGCDCDRCSGTGNDPSGWTLRLARQDPRAWHAAQLMMDGTDEVVGPDDPRLEPHRASHRVNVGGTMALFADVVSPIPFEGSCGGDDDGLEPYRWDYGTLRCRSCHGRGYHLADPVVEVIGHRPAVQKNPDRRLWHVEKDGQIIQSGIGLKACRGYWKHDDRECCEGARKLAAKIDGIALKHAKRGAGGSAPKSAPAPSESDAEIETPGVVVVENEEKDGVEVYFSEKPSDDVRIELKSNRFRWSRRNACWYRRRSPEALNFAASLVA